MEITFQEAQMVAAALRAFENTASSDGPHWSYEPEWQQFQRRINICARSREFIKLHTDRGLPIGESIHRDGKEYKIVNNDRTTITTAVLV